MQDPFRVQNTDILSNILYVQRKSTELSVLAHRLMRVAKFAPETCVTVANHYSLRGQHERAVLFLRRATIADPSFLSAWTLMGHEFIELKNSNAAVACYRKAVLLSEREYRAWYGLGMTYELLQLPQLALHYYLKAASLRPDDARMWVAVGNCFIQAGREEEGKVALWRALEVDPHDMTALRELKKVLERHGEEEKAVECAELFVELMPADQVQDPDYVESLLFLAHFHKAAGNFQAALGYASRLLETSGSEASEARVLVKELTDLGYEV